MVFRLEDCWKLTVWILQTLILAGDGKLQSSTTQYTVQCTVPFGFWLYRTEHFQYSTMCCTIYCTVKNNVTRTVQNNVKLSLSTVQYSTLQYGTACTIHCPAQTHYSDLKLPDYNEAPFLSWVLNVVRVNDHVQFTPGNSQAAIGN